MLTCVQRLEVDLEIIIQANKVRHGHDDGCA
jgi:hypothetical protein